MREEQFLCDLTDFFTHFVLNWRCPKVEFGNDCLHLTKKLLGFLQNMNLTSLVREFEMEAAAASGEGGAQHLGILSLADDVDTENPFSELEDHDHHEQSNGNMTDSLNDIGFE